MYLNIDLFLQSNLALIIPPMYILQPSQTTISIQSSKTNPYNKTNPLISSKIIINIYNPHNPQTSIILNPHFLISTANHTLYSAIPNILSTWLFKSNTNFKTHFQINYPN